MFHGRKLPAGPQEQNHGRGAEMAGRRRRAMNKENNIRASNSLHKRGSDDEMQFYLEKESRRKGEDYNETGKPRRSVSMDGNEISMEGRQIFGSPFSDISALFSFRRELGRGTSGVVYNCTDIRTQAQVACKTISKSFLNNAFDLQDILGEVSCLRKLQEHPAVIAFKGVFEDKENVHLVMEYCKGGDLFDRITQRRYFSEPEAAIICRTVASVLHFAHKNGVMHRDLKPENILLKSNYVDTDIRVADFGSATFFKQGRRLNQLVGSPIYIAPEVLKNNYGPGADLWSLGVILYVMLSGSPPFLGRSKAEILKEVQFAPIDMDSGRWKFISKGAKKLVSQLLNRDDEQRITARQVLNDPWISKNCSAMDDVGESSDVKTYFHPSDLRMYEEESIRNGNARVSFHPSLSDISSQVAVDSVGLKSVFERSPTPFYPSQAVLDDLDNEFEDSGESDGVGTSQSTVAGDEDIFVAELVRESPIQSLHFPDGFKVWQKQAATGSKFFGNRATQK